MPLDRTHASYATPVLFVQSVHMAGRGHRGSAWQPASHVGWSQCGNAGICVGKL